MADPNTRIQNLENDIRQLHSELNAEKSERIASETEIRGQIEKLALLLSDNNDATGYLIQYFNKMDMQYYARELALQEAIQDFNNFLRLPEKSNKTFEYWVAAWTILSSLAPALRLGSAFQKMEKEAQIVLSTAKAFRKPITLTMKIPSYMAKAHSIADVIYKGNNVIDKVGKAAGGGGSAPARDSTKSPVKELMDEAKQAHKALDAAIQAVDSDFKARIDDVLNIAQYSPKQSLLELAKKLCPDPGYFSDDQLEQIQRRYLWLILKVYAQRNVAVVTTKLRGGPITTVEGFNENQQDQIMEWFGFSSNWQGGDVPPAYNIWVVLYQWGVEQRTEVSNSFIFGFD